jgi:hypothetical protein
VAATTGSAQTRTGGGRSASTNPVLAWHPDAKNPKTVIKTDAVTVRTNPVHVISAEAVCAQNGVSVNFELHGADDKIGPMFVSHSDPTSNGDDLVADVNVRMDGQSHVAKAWLTQYQGNNVVNEIGVLFYEPGIAARVRGEQRLQVSGLGDLTGALVGAAADADVQEGIRTSAGPLADLVNARSIRVDLPVQQGNYEASLELSPQNELFHEFAVRCYERFGGRVTPAAPSTAPRRAPSK